MDLALIICTVAIAVLLIVTIVMVSGLRRSVSSGVNASMQELADRIRQSDRDSSEMLDKRLRETADLQDKRIKENNENVDRRLADMSKRISDMAVENEQKLDSVRTTMETKITALTEDNNRQLDRMRETVDEKLQKTLNERISKSFELVNQRLQDVTEGIGAMKNIAKDVNGLSNVLSNVKTRGILGEVQLGAILKEILSPDQYEENVNVVGHGRDVVEFAVKFPGEGSDTVYLPIDSKFPGETYQKYRDALESGGKAAITAAGKTLDAEIKKEAKDISSKYIAPPKTTDFAIMFLPFEGLYAEVINRGFVETLQRDYKVVIAGPTTMSALLNSLQMGFKTLAIQKRTSEVWDTLADVKTEFATFADVLTKTQKNLDQASDNLDKLIGVRTRKINKSLASVTTMPVPGSDNIIEAESAAPADGPVTADHETEEDEG